jgi:predicted small integral membrane protein
VDQFAWMAWTPQTGLFFALLAGTLTAMTMLALARPEAERVGVLGIPTTRGDRLFISLVTAAVIHLIWVGIAGTSTILTLPIGEGIEVSSLWLATAISLVVAVGIFRTV